MRVEVRQAPLGEIEADLAVVGLYEDEALPGELAEAAGAGDARGGFQKLALLHPERPARLLVVGLGKREAADAERFRLAAAVAAKEAGRLEAASLAWLLPESGDDDATADAIVTGTILADYRFDRLKSSDPGEPPAPRIESLTLAGRESVAEATEGARICAEAQNRSRDLQSLPSNVATPSYLGRRARELASHHAKVSAEVIGRDEIAAKGMGGIVAVSQGSAEEPKLIVLRYEGGGSAPKLGLVGKGVTFDTGGISLKPSAAMHEMKMDMSGAAAVLEAVGAIAELGLPLNLVAVVPATENMPSGTAIKPGDVITQYNGKTVEINNTDAEGRLILADGLGVVRRYEPDLIIDVATLTGAAHVALGDKIAAVFGSDSEVSTQVLEAASRAGEHFWELPLFKDYKKSIESDIADLKNISGGRYGGAITAALFLSSYVDDEKWAHLDIAGPARSRETAGEHVKGASGVGVRTLVELARSLIEAS